MLKCNGLKQEHASVFLPEHPAFALCPTGEPRLVPFAIFIFFYAFKNHYNMSSEIIRAGIIGAGAMGKGLLYQSIITPGIECVALCDRNITTAVSALQSFGKPFAVVGSAEAMLDAVSKGLVAVCSDGLLVSGCGMVDVVIEASSAIAAAGLHAIEAMQAKKDVVLMNSEIDLLFGPLLLDTAARNKVVCTSCDGDQYGVLKHLLDDLDGWGFEVVMAGNIKGFLDRYANPTTIVHEADKRNLDYRMCTSYTDGTKLNIEMAIIANACGMETKTAGMYGPALGDIRQVMECFDFNALRSPHRPFVDYVLGAEPGGGVFVIGYCDDPYQQQMLAYYKMGNGPFYLFYRPYHLCHIEAMKTVLEAVREKRVLLQPDSGFRTNVYAYAKKDLEAGTVLDGIGGYCCYGMIENTRDNIAHPGLPVCLAEQVVLRKAVSRDAKIFMDEVDYDQGRDDFRLFGEAMRKAGTIGLPTTTCMSA